MSEAENLNLSSDSVLNSPETETGWTTVNLPGAIEIDTIPQADPEPSQVGLRIKDLEQHNHQLRSRVAQLEFALGEAHATLRAETKRLETQIGTQQAEAEQRSLRSTHLTQQQAAMILKQRQALKASHHKLADQEAHIAAHLQTISDHQADINQLSQSLDQAHQAQQKQQILIETLTAQLEASQTQVAQLERDCALTKQRYDDQIQELRQTESACRDLRSRLHRQQQYTLQFKAALEKCLDVSVTQKIEESVDHAISESEQNADSISFVKSQPVQPWSTTLDYSAWEPEQYTLALPPDSVWATVPDDASLFEEEPDPQLEVSTPEASETFEIENYELAQPELTQPELTVQPPLSYTIAKSIREEKPAVHHNIDLFVPSANRATIVEPLESATVIEPETVLQDEITESITEPIEAPEEIAANPFSLALPAADEPSIATPSLFITLSAEDRVHEPIVIPTLEESPSPVVYPQRSQKKRESLAAVELPSFPRSGQ